MSIIHNALKKVQQGLSPKTDEPEVIAPTATETVPANLYETPSEIEVLPQAGQQTTRQKPPMKNTIKNTLIICCAAAVIAGSGFYLYHQFQGNITQVNRLAQKSFYKLIHKKEPPPAFKTKTPEELKPLARLTISSAQTSSPITLNIHGIMSNGHGNLVLINDQVYQEGDEVDGAKIAKINLDSITVIVNGAEKTIFVKN